VPFEDLEFLTKQNAIRTNGSATASEAQIASDTLLIYIGKLVDQRMEDAKDDLISKLVVEQVNAIFIVILDDSLLTSVQVKPGHLERMDAVQIAFLLLVAGNATMVNMINLVRFFFESQKILQELTLHLGCCNSPPTSLAISRPHIAPVSGAHVCRRTLPLPYCFRTCYETCSKGRC
jgi:nitric oxide reductase